MIHYWKILDGKSDRPKAVNVSSTMNYHILKDLHPRTTYEATITAVNEVGESLPSKSINFETGEEEPSSPPIDVMSTALSPYTIRITWKTPSENTLNGKLTGYLVGFKPSHDYKSPLSYRSVDSASQNGTYEYFLNNLVKDTLYSISVMAVNSAGNGPESAEIKLKTLSGDVPEGPVFHVISSALDEVLIKYTAIKTKAPSTLHLSVHFKEASESFWKEFTIIPSTDETGEYTLTNLYPSTLYMIYLTATNEFGDSDPSRIIRVRTSGYLKDNVFAKSYMEADSFQYPVLPVTIAFAVVTIVIVLAFVYVRKAQIEANKPNVEFCSKLRPGFGPNDTLRYITTDSEKPLMQVNSRMDFDNQFNTHRNSKVIQLLLKIGLHI